MRAIVFLGERKLDLMEVPDPTPAPDEVVIEIKASGMCGTLLHQPAPQQQSNNRSLNLNVSSSFHHSRLNCQCQPLPPID